MNIRHLCVDISLEIMRTDFFDFLDGWILSIPYRRWKSYHHL